MITLCTTLLQLHLGSKFMSLCSISNILYARWAMFCPESKQRHQNLGQIVEELPSLQVQGGALLEPNAGITLAICGKLHPKCSKKSSSSCARTAMTCNKNRLPSMALSLFSQILSTLFMMAPTTTANRSLMDRLQSTNTAMSA